MGSPLQICVRIDHVITAPHCIQTYDIIEDFLFITRTMFEIDHTIIVEQNAIYVFQTYQYVSQSATRHAEDSYAQHTIS